MSLSNLHLIRSHVITDPLNTVPCDPQASSLFRVERPGAAALLLLSGPSVLFLGNPAKITLLFLPLNPDTKTFYEALVCTFPTLGLASV